MRTDRPSTLPERAAAQGMRNRNPLSRALDIATLTGASVWACLAAGQEAVPVQLTPGTTAIRRLEHAPTDGRYAFSVAASRGQTLLIEWDPASMSQYDSDSKLRVFAPGEREPPFPEDAQGQWMHVLRQSGVYRVVLDLPAGKPYVLRMTLLDPRDPRLDPGLRPEKVWIDLAALGIHEKLSLQPFTPPPADLTVDEPWPASLAIVRTGKIEVRIMSVEAIRNTFWRDDGSEWEKRLALLERSLQPGVKPAAPFDLPMNRIDEAELDFAAVEKRVDGTWFRALRWVATFSTPPAVPRNPFTYVAEGISRDGRYFLLMRAAVTHPAAIAGPGDIDDGPELQALKAHIAGKLAAAPSSSYQPELATLDGIVASLKLP